MKKIILVSLFLVYANISQAQWQPDLRLTNDPAFSSLSVNNTSCIAASGNNVHVVWYDTRDGDWEIYYKRSTDKGISWGTDTRLTNNTAFSGYPTVALSGSVVHVVWYDFRDGNWEIYYKHSTDAGISWGTDTRLTNDPAFSGFPSMSVSGSSVHIVWREQRNGNYDIYYKRSTDGGFSWEADTRLTNDSADSYLSSIASSGSIINVLWADNRDGDWEIYNKRSVDGGSSWGQDTRLTNSSGFSFDPSVSASGSDVHAVWLDERDGNYEIYYKRSTNGGLNWGGDTRLTNNPDSSWQPFISVCGSNVHVIWIDTRDGNPEIYYKNSVDGGLSWGSDTRLTNNLSGVYFPSMTFNGQFVHVLWRDDRDGNTEIYYKRDSTNNCTGEPCLNPPIVNAGNDTTIYYGYGVQYALLTASVTGGNPPYSFLWSNGATTASITVSPANTTRYNVMITDLNGCSSGDSVLVNVIDIRCGDRNEKILVCHRGNTICISPNAVQSHLRHGDHLGDCEDNKSIMGPENGTPDKYELHANYPNPFNPVTSIRFDLPKSSFSKLVIYDVLGKEIVILVNEQLPAGTYNIDWDASEYSSGVYYYWLYAGEFTETHKMILIK
jgi:hypothetical protein